MFIRSKVVKGRTYYQAVESYRDSKDGRVRQKTLASLGTHPTIEPAFREAVKRYFDSRKGRKTAPFTDADRAAWKRLQKLENLLFKQGCGNYGYGRDPSLQAEVTRVARAARKAERERKQRTWDELTAKWRAEEERVRIFATLGLIPPVTLAQVRAAYHSKARECHPDHGGSDEAMAAVNNAYEALMIIKMD